MNTTPEDVDTLDIGPSPARETTIAGLRMISVAADDLADTLDTLDLGSGDLPPDASLEARMIALLGEVEHELIENSERSDRGRSLALARTHVESAVGALVDARAHALAADELGE